MTNPLLSLRNKLYWRKLRQLSGEVSKAIDLGSGPTPKNDFLAEECWGLDIVASDYPNYISCDVSLGRILAATEDFDLVTAYDFLEHIPRVVVDQGKTNFPFVELMNEVFRILRPSGKFYSYTPVYPHKSAFQDPTHVNIMTKDTLRMYFTGQSPLASAYGFNGRFREVASGRKGSHRWTLLEKTDN